MNDTDDQQGPSKGYDDFKQVVQDLEAVFDVVWVSGTRMCDHLSLSKPCLVCIQVFHPLSSAFQVLILLW